jgi:hypothetical protein
LDLFGYDIFLSAAFVFDVSLGNALLFDPFSQLSFFCLHRMLAIRKQRPANRADCAVTAAGGAVLPSIENQLNMQLVPALRRKEFFKIGLGLLNAFAVRQLPALREAVDMRIDRKRRNAERLREILSSPVSPVSVLLFRHFATFKTPETQDVSNRLAGGGQRF